MLVPGTIRRKLCVLSGVLLVTVIILALTGFRGVYAYRGLARSISRRASELPVATRLSEQVDQLRLALVEPPRTKFSSDDSPDHYDDGSWRYDIDHRLAFVQTTLDIYRNELINNQLAESRMDDNSREWQTVHKLEAALTHIRELLARQKSMIGDHQPDELAEHISVIQQLSAELPSYLTQRMQDFATDVRLQYRTWIVLAWLTSISGGGLLVLLGILFRLWVLGPLDMLITGSRHIAQGNFQYRIRVPSQDEMGELAAAMNDMTTRFCQIRDDLDRQVQQRTKEVVRSEQMASVGFLAAGVAHEINNPLASIAWCAESLEQRLHDIIQQDDALPDDQHNAEISVLRNYLRMIQDEAFRCTGIIGGLLDFSRMGDVERHDTDIAELIHNVIEMIRHVGAYKEKRMVFDHPQPMIVRANPQEMKQVVLNLITNALDSLDPGGTVTVTLEPSGQEAHIVVRDDGCGMNAEVLQHLFEPFFTRRRDGQGTGLGLSISYRIIQDHGGRIDAHSAGPGHGSTFSVSLPLANPEKPHEKINRAA